MSQREDDPGNAENVGPSAIRPAHLAPHGPTPRFQFIVKLFEECSKSKLEGRRNHLFKWFDNWRKIVGPDLYPALRLILPQKDRERATYGFKETTLAKAFIHAFGLNEKSVDAQSLLNWKRPDQSDVAAGDFPTVLYQTLSSRSSVREGSMTIEDLNNILDDLSRGFRPSAKDKERNIFRTISEKCTPNEIRWIARIILEDLTIGIKESTVFAVFHEDAMDLFNSCSDLKKVAWDLADPKSHLHDTEKAVRLFKPFQPMLCGRSKTLRDAVKAIVSDSKEKTFIMEEKLDGERMQLHKRGNEFLYCSRKGKDYTHLYGSNVSNGSLTPFIAEAFDPRVTDVILDGEMMVWDPVIERYLPFGHLKTSALDKDPGPDKPRPCFKVFDILYINLMGSTTLLTNKTLNVRLNTLKNLGLFHTVDGRLEFALQRIGKDATDVETFLQEVVEDRGEGLVLKRGISGYHLAARESRWWVKVKPEYVDNMGEAADVLVVGANWGSGHRGGRISTLICAVRDDLHQANVASSSTVNYRTFVRIGTGLSLDDFEWINEKPWKPFHKHKPPSWLKVADAGYDDKGDVYLEPEDSFLITVKAASVITSDQYGTGMTLRFPRCKGIRRDLSVDDCLSFSEMVEMASGKRKNEATEKMCVKKRKTALRKVLISASHRGVRLSGTDVISNLFVGKKFREFSSHSLLISDMVLTVWKDVIMATGRAQKYTKQEIEKKIQLHGGAIVQNFSKIPAVIVVYGGIVHNVPVTSIVSKGVQDIIKPEWIMDCIEQERIVPMSKEYFFHATDERKKDPDYEGSETESENDDVNKTEAHEEFESDEESDDDDSSWTKLSKEDTEAASATMERIRNLKEDESETESEGGASLVDGGSDTTEGDREEPSVPDSAKRGSREDTEMGAPGVTEYDPEHIFSHLVFYLDSPSNARAHRMEVEVSKEVEASISEEWVPVITLAPHRFEHAENGIISNGGKMTRSLDEPKLTHIVLHERDLGRRVELLRRNPTSKRRHLVLISFVTLCLQEESLLDEDGFSP
ncbi:hypothetical protein BS47DRAFT_1290225 [Hydnum rufescens UP504]|uniref:DNA ligase n=1 Tax=Hydnum rufescens UP504 TaxID=1448309 RepID=A0A9P6B6S1_9AGAM|nr:hypothetical protein BS47DRAFT_1290225 [Hydnum rufescens UP504]